LLAIDAVEALLEDGVIARADIAGDGTALVYVTAAAYGASNRAFVEGGGGALHFPYTAPSAVPAEVAIEFGLHGPYAVLIGGAATTIDGLEHARTLLGRGACARALVLAVETFAECADLHARARWLHDRPLVEAAAAVLLEAGGGQNGDERTMPDGTTAKDIMIGETLACGPLIALALARAGGREDVVARGRWRGRETALTLGVRAAARTS
jgi:3-oxoacyl-[acyl-carrier-protein] synthase III